MPQTELHHQLLRMVRCSERLMTALAVVRSLELPSWCIGAGAVRSLVWDSLHRFERASDLADIDVVYFDSDVEDLAVDVRHQKHLFELMPNIQWEVTNQAMVHRWFAETRGQTVAPFRSMEEGVASWPEVATCVGVSLAHTGELSVVAPHGLTDLFELRVRHNTGRVAAYCCQNNSPMRENSSFVYRGEQSEHAKGHLLDVSACDWEIDAQSQPRNENAGAESVCVQRGASQASSAQVRRSRDDRR